MSSAEESKAEGASEATEGTESSSERAESSDASDDLKANADQVASTQTTPAVPKTPAQQQPAPAQDSPAISKPSSIPSSPTPTPTPKSSDASDDLKASADQVASTQATPAVPKTPAQQQPAPAQDSPAISKPSSIPSSPTPTPTPTPKSSDGPKGLDQGEELKLLLEKLRNFFKLSNWIKQDDQTSQWQKLRRPVLLIAALITLVIFVRIYGGILSTIESVPLAPSLFEMAGILWLTWFSITRLIRSEDRQDVISRVRTRWEAFRGTTDNKP